MAVPIHVDDGNASGGKPVRLFGPVRWNEFDIAHNGRQLAVVVE